MPGRLNSGGSMMCSGPSRRVNATCCVGVHVDVAEQQDAVAVPRLLDFRERRVVDVAAEVDADHLGAERFVQGAEGGGSCGK